jgi:hypothetical protein
MVGASLELLSLEEIFEIVQENILLSISGFISRALKS